MSLSSSRIIWVSVLALCGLGPLLGHHGRDPQSEPRQEGFGATIVAATSGPLTQARVGHTATLLPSGKVIIAGGAGPAGVLNTAEVFDPVTLSATALTSGLTTARTEHTATLLPQTETLLIAGRDNLGLLFSTEMFNPANHTFRALSPNVRAGHTATLLLDGRVLITGGQSWWALGSAEAFNAQTVVVFKKPAYDPEAGTFTVLPNGLVASRWDHTATLLADGRILIAGGRNDTGILASAEIIDPATETVTTLADAMPTPRAGHTATLLPDGRVLVLGGEGPSGARASADEFNPSTNSFSAVTSGLTTARVDHTATLLPTGIVLIAGGQNSGGILASTELYTPSPADAMAPVVNQVAPPSGAAGVDMTEIIGVRFSEPVDVRTLTATSVTLSSGDAVAATISPGEQGLMVFVVPSAPLAAGTTYTLSLSSDIKDTAGNALAPFTSEFTTVAAPAITGFMPGNGPPRTSVTITGSNFDPVASRNEVKFNGALATVTAASATSLTAIVPRGATTGPITVTTPGGTATSATTFTVITQRPPMIGIFTPAGQALVAPGAEAATQDTTRPAVTATVPANAATGAALNARVAVTFSEAMDPRTITKETFTLRQGTRDVKGKVNYVGVTAIFEPVGHLTPNTAYTATITTGARDLAGNTLASNFVWSFTTGATRDRTRPTVSATAPDNAATGVAITGKIVATFSEPMDPSTIDKATFDLKQGTRPVAGTVTYTGVTATFAPAANLAPNTVYTARIKPGVKDLAGNPMATEPFVWTFTTGATADTTRPTVSATVPANAATGVAFSQTIAATFSEAMDPLSITTVTFTLKQGTTPLAGTVTYAGVTATFNPLNNLAPNTTYTATITTGARDLAGNALATDFVWAFTTGATPDMTRPTVSATVPANTATGVAISGSIAAAFSVAMDPLTITTVTFTLRQGTTAVAGTVTYAGVTATFNPLNNLAPNTTYTATITTGARDLAGTALATDFVWTFTTGATPDTTRPTVSATVPVNAAIGVAINHTVTAAFSEAMDPLTVSTATFTLQQGTTAVAGTVSYAGVTGTFTPTSALAPLTTYTARITTGARDLAGNALAIDFGWSFTTGATLDTIAPTVSATVPADGATAVPINQTMNATFSEAMDPLTISTASLRLTGSGGTAVTGTVAYDVPSRIATLNPVSNLAPNTVYTATITIGARDLAGNALGANFVWSFTTAATAAGQAPVALGAAGTFAVLAASTVTNTGATTVNGDLGLSPGTAVTGFPPGTVNGTIHAADAAAARAQLDLTDAYNDAAGRTEGAIALAGNIGGQTLTPGLYKSTSSLEISSGDLTLDAQGDANAVFIFQMGSTLVTTSGRQVILSGGARAANVFWQVGSSATLGTGSVFKGNILALASITVTTGATVEGRLLARTAAVTLDSNVIGLAIPADAAAPTVSFTVPANGATGVPLSGRIAATFSEVMEPSTISTPTFVLKRGTTAVDGTVTYAGVTAIREATAAVQAPVALGSASNFAVLAASTVTNTGATTVNGDLGLSPGTAVTGFPPGTVNGAIHAADAAAAQAQQDLTTAYNDAAGRTIGAIAVAGNLGGQILTPGLYKSTSSLEISSGDLTLDALGDANAVFIFQMGSTLTTTVGRQVILSGGAQAANVFWQVGSSATLGTGSVFKGTILALASITVTTGATVEGRLLARTAAVTLDSNVIGLPIPVGALDSTTPAWLAPGAIPAVTPVSLTSAGPAPVALGSASTFAVLAASTVTNTGATTVTGNLGLSPGTAVTGFPPGTVNGTIHAADAAAAQAQLDLTAAYNDAAGRTGAITLAGNIGGLTLTPGLYKSTSSLEISSGDLTLDAQGDANAVFIFQMGSTLVTTSGRQVILSGGARAANVFWQVGSSATLGTGSVFKGNILALASITVTTGVTVEGRLLARTAAVTLDSNDIRLPLAAVLTPLTTYTATMTTAARDLAGNPLPTDVSWTFTTGATLDTTRPTVSATVPANFATGVAVNHTITAAFSEAMDPLTVNSATFTLRQGTTAVAGTVSYAGVTATFTPASALAPLTTYTARITIGSRDLAGNALATDFGSSFTTGAAPDTTRPTVSATVPADGATAVPINQTLNATFSEAMDPLTISTASLRLAGLGGTVVTGTVAYDVRSRIATLNPVINLAPNTVYTATITIGARDLAGNAVGANFVWSFTTAATAAGQAPVALGAASTFAVLAGSTVTNTGATTVNGDLGLSPGTAVTGFPPGTVNGTIHAADAAAAQAQLDLTTAYNDAAGRTEGAIGIAGNLGGLTLTPGLYKSTSSLEISSGDLTLDAQGDANAVFIFQMGSTLTTTVGRQVILTGGARAANVFWQVGSSATLGTGSVFKGNILALASITVTTGAVVEGRLLARTAAVTLDTNVIGLAIPAGTTAFISAGPAPVPLGVAGTFAVLAASTVTNTGATVVNGDLGLSPGTAVTGFPPGTVNGTIHAADAAAAQAQQALTAAYNDAAGRTEGAIAVAGNLGGLTLTPGLYKSTSSLEISSGDLTLDSQGDPNAVFLFQMGSTLVTTVGRQVILTGGAQAANVFWQVGSSATLGTGSVFKGNILALASITVTTGATVEGRLLARTAAVTLDSNNISLPTSAGTTAPAVTATVPAGAATAVPINQAINVTFSEAMDPLTINTATFTLKQGTTAVAGTVSYTGVTATFTPAGNLVPLTVYTATITTGATDLAGNPLPTDFVWTFTTAATAAGQAPIVLGTASTFAVLAASTVTNTGATTVNGDLGLSPGTSVTGFPPGTVNGSMNVADAAAAQAQLDLTTAYDDAAGRTEGAIAVAGNLGGLTLTPGLYKSTSSLAISSGDLTLDAQGDPNAVFIFQMGSTLVTTVGRQVILSGGARAANVFWQVGSSATLGTGSVFKGNILALASITATTGATVEGRLLARTAAVTLDSNTITIPVP